MVAARSGKISYGLSYYSATLRRDTIRYMQPLKKKIGELKKEIAQAKSALKFADLEQNLAELDERLNQPH